MLTLPYASRGPCDRHGNQARSQPGNHPTGSDDAIGVALTAPESMESRCRGAP